MTYFRKLIKRIKYCQIKIKNSYMIIQGFLRIRMMIFINHIKLFEVYSKK